MKRFYVYIYKDPRPEKAELPIYIGKGKSEHDRAFVHWRRGNHNPIMRRILAKIKDAGLEPIIEIVDWFDDEADAFTRERELISQFGRRDIKTGCLANMTDGGEGSANPSPVTRAKQSAAVKGRKMPPSHGEKISAAKRGKPLSEKHRIALGGGQKRRWATADEKAKAKLLANLDFTGRRHTSKTIALMKRIHTGKKMPDTEGMRRLSAQRRGIKLPPEQRAKMSASQYARWRRAKTSLNQLGLGL